MNFVRYIRDNGLLNTDFDLVNGRKVRILSVDFYPAKQKHILGYDLDTRTLISWNTAGQHMSRAAYDPGFDLAVPVRTIWVVTYPDDKPEAYYEKSNAVAIANYNNENGLGPSDVHEVTLSNDTKVQL